MATYTFTEPDVIPIKYNGVEDRYYELQYDYMVQVDVGIVKSLLITIPKGYVTDLASIPRFVWTLTGLTPDGLYRGAAVVHDYIYGKKVKVKPYSDVSVLGMSKPLRLTREDCDNIFKQLILASGEASWKANVMFWAVRTFGGFFYKDR